MVSSACEIIVLLKYFFYCGLGSIVSVCKGGRVHLLRIGNELSTLVRNCIGDEARLTSSDSETF